jgi:hypothetical protein
MSEKIYSSKSIPWAPIFTPTKEEFSNFFTYILKIKNNPKYKDLGGLKVN